MPSSKAPRRLLDIVENAQAIFRYTEGMSAAEFEEDRRTYDAVERCLQRITEAVYKLGDLAPVLMPDQPWKKIRSLGNILRHEYDSIEGGRLFDIVKKDLPSLCAAAEEAVRQWDLKNL